MPLFKQDQIAAKAVINDNTITLLSGKAGSGKTFVAMYQAHVARTKNSKKIVCIVPIVDNDELGFIRGSVDEKIAPRIVALKEIYKYFLNDNPIKRDMITFITPSLLRGLTFEDSFIVVDECQNLTTHQLKLIIGRMGVGSKIVFCGDHTQIDLHDPSQSCIGPLKTMCIDVKGCKEYELQENRRHELVPQLLENLAQYS